MLQSLIAAMFLVSAPVMANEMVKVRVKINEQSGPAKPGPRAALEAGLVFSKDEVEIELKPAKADSVLDTIHSGTYTAPGFDLKLTVTKTEDDYGRIFYTSQLELDGATATLTAKSLDDLLTHQLGGPKLFKAERFRIHHATIEFLP